MRTLYSKALRMLCTYHIRMLSTLCLLLICTYIVRMLCTWVAVLVALCSCTIPVRSRYFTYYWGYIPDQGSNVYPKADRSFGGRKESANEHD
jgi:hypothetical protein